MGNEHPRSEERTRLGSHSKPRGQLSQGEISFCKEIIHFNTSVAPRVRGTPDPRFKKTVIGLSWGHVHTVEYKSRGQSQLAPPDEADSKGVSRTFFDHVTGVSRP